MAAGTAPKYRDCSWDPIRLIPDRRPWSHWVPEALAARSDLGAAVRVFQDQSRPGAQACRRCPRRPGSRTLVMPRSHSTSHSAVGATSMFLLEEMPALKCRRSRKERAVGGVERITATGASHSSSGGVERGTRRCNCVTFLRPEQALGLAAP
jgi:hypothetical protein